MTDAVERLRILETWLAEQLAEVNRQIVAAERAEAAETQRPRWWIQWHRRRVGVEPSGELHEEGCWRPGFPTLAIDEARQALAEHGRRIRTCEVCRAEVPAG